MSTVPAPGVPGQPGWAIRARVMVQTGALVGGPVTHVRALGFTGAPLVLTGAEGCSVCERAVLDFKFSS
jgi:hypothetical protein